METKIELHQIHLWDCPNCGLENLVRAPKLEGKLWRPKEVKCNSCPSKFEVLPEEEQEQYALI